MQFSKPVSFLGREGRGGHVSFSTDEGEALLVKVGISYVSEANAKLNLEAELSGWDFDALREEASAEWNQQLAKIDVEGGRPTNKRTSILRSIT